MIWSFWVVSESLLFRGATNPPAASGSSSSLFSHSQVVSSAMSHPGSFSKWMVSDPLSVARLDMLRRLASVNRRSTR